VLSWTGELSIDAPVFFVGAYSSRDAGGCIGDPPVVYKIRYCVAP